MMKAERIKSLMFLPLIITFFIIPFLTSFVGNQQDYPAGAQDQVIEISPTPTIDRLAEPTLPSNFGQADEGAQDFWLYCLPCHGDRGQGLTDEFRLLYPPEDRNCWDSGCHGKRPYDNGFRLPDAVPPIIGNESNLSRFTNARNLFSYIQFRMPYNEPASLDDEMYWRLTAFLIRENNLATLPVMLNEENGQSIQFVRSDSSVHPTKTPLLQLPQKNTTPTLVEEYEETDEIVEDKHGFPILMIIFGVICVVILALGLLFVYKEPIT